MSGSLILFDDARADGWAPFALTRPCGELRFGRWTLRGRVERAAGRGVAGHLTRPWLARYREGGAPPVLRPDALPPGPRTLWSSRAVPDLDASWPSGPANLWVDGGLAGVALPADADAPDADWYREPSALPALPDARLPGRWLDHAWDLVARGPARLEADLTARAAESSASAVPEGCWKIGDGPLLAAGDARIEPGVLFDTRNGPIELGPGVEVATGARLEGPLYAGPRSRLLGGAISVFSGGACCYVRGEIEEVTILGYTNKAHDGFLGHALLGRWVNLGAMTTNSDLKNNYGTIRVGRRDAAVDTGLVKLGCLIGDHAKTGIGVLLNTGTVVGAGSNLFGAELPPKWVEPFSWGRGEELELYRRDAFLATATAVMGRRGVATDADVTRWLGDVWDAARASP